MASYLNFPFDAEIFNYSWRNEPDMVLTNMIDSGAVVRDGAIENMISNGSNFYTIPYYDVLGGTPVLYDGATDIPTTETTGGQLAGAVYGRAKGWSVKSFIKDFNSGADPMQQVVSGVAKYWQKQRQLSFINILKGVFGVSAFSSHIKETALRITATDINDAIVGACGDNADGFSLAIMHSTVANTLAKLQLLDYAKYTDANGIQKALPLATVNGMTVIINDLVGTERVMEYTPTEDVALDTAKTYYTVDAKGDYKVVTTPAVADIASYYELTTDYTKYNTFILGTGAIGYGVAPVDVPSEFDRNPATNGGVDMIYTRIRETFLPYGFAFKSSALTNNVGVSDTSLATGSNWTLEYPAESVKMVKLITRG